MLRRHQDALRALPRHPSWTHEGSSGALRAIVSLASETMQVARVGVWLFDDTRARLVCEVQHGGAGAQAHDATLTRDRYPGYLAAMERSHAIAADDALHHAATRELADSYLAPAGVRAVLAAPVMRRGACEGILCHEHIGSTRRWTGQEQAFAGSMGDFVALALEMREHERAERRYRDRDRATMRALASARTGAWSYDRDGVRWMGSIGELLGLDPEFAPDYADYLELIHPLDRPKAEALVARAIEAGEGDYEIEHRVTWPDGSEHWLEGRAHAFPDSSGRPSQVCGTIADVTRRKRLELELRQIHKLDAIGRLAGGVAHEFNNLLTAIMCSSAVLDRRTTERETRAHLAQIRDAATRAGQLTSQLLALGRRPTLHIEVADLRCVLREATSRLRELLDDTIALSVEAETDALTVRADPALLEHVLVNLVINARDALGSGGAIRVSLSRASGEEAGRDGVPEPRACARIDVSDNGPGLAPGIEEHLFEPFFSTRDDHRNGLGLSTCYGIARQLGGSIFYRSQPQIGTTFSVLIPLTETARAADSAPATVAASLGGETVLYVEDEPMIRDVVAKVLRAEGYSVLVAATGASALELARTTAGHIGLAVIDVILPDARGDQLAVELVALHPEARVLLVSGYADHLVLRPEGDLAGTAFLAKPFSPEQLIDKVRAVLDER